MPVIRVGVGWPSLGEGGLTLALRLHGALGSRFNFEGVTKGASSLMGRSCLPGTLGVYLGRGLLHQACQELGLGKHSSGGWVRVIPEFLGHL